ncbi:hypothetical protein CPB97_011676 [Podila verticillata]|nr:hypothetical protein CPB97_011676 [Podila verticillata]
MGGSGGRVRLSKRMILSGSLLMMALFYYVSLPEPLMYPSGGADAGRKGSLADDTEIVMDASSTRGNDARVSHESSMKVKGETIGKSSKQRNYNFEDTRADTASCGLVNNDSSDSGSCAPASSKKHKDLENNRFSTAIEEDDSASKLSEASEVNVEWSKAKERESIQEEDDDQGNEKEDGSMIESEAERVDREEKETIAATIEAEIKREEAESRGVDKTIEEAIEAFKEIVEEEEEEYEEEEDVTSEADLEKVYGESDDEEDEEDERASDGDMHRFVEGLFLGEDGFTEEEEEEYRKEDRLGQAGPLETMDDEE